jgi:hypothetical protein
VRLQLLGRSLDLYLHGGLLIDRCTAIIAAPVTASANRLRIRGLVSPKAHSLVLTTSDPAASFPGRTPGDKDTFK